MIAAGEKKQSVYEVLQEAKLNLLQQMREEHLRLDLKIEDALSISAEKNIFELSEVIAEIEEDLIWLEQLRLDINELDRKCWSLELDFSQQKDIQQKIPAADDIERILREIQLMNRKLQISLREIMRQPGFKKGLKEEFFYNAVATLRETNSGTVRKNPA